MRKIQKNSKTKVFAIHDAWQIGGNEPFPADFQHFIDEKRLQRLAGGFAVANFTQAKNQVPADELPQAHAGCGWQRPARHTTGFSLSRPKILPKVIILWKNNFRQH